MAKPHESESLLDEEKRREAREELQDAEREIRDAKQLLLEVKADTGKAASTKQTSQLRFANDQLERAEVIIEDIKNEQLIG